MRYFLFFVLIGICYASNSQEFSISYSFGSGIVKEEDPDPWSIYPEHDERGPFSDISLKYGINKWFGFVVRYSILGNAFNAELRSEDLKSNNAYNGYNLVPVQKIFRKNNKAILGGVQFKIPHQIFGLFFSPKAGLGFIEKPDYSIITDDDETANWTFENAKAMLMLEFEVGILTNVYKFIYIKASYSTFGGSFDYNLYFHEARYDGQQKLNESELLDYPSTFIGDKWMIGLEFNISQLIQEIKPHNSR